MNPMRFAIVIATRHPKNLMLLGQRRDDSGDTGSQGLQDACQGGNLRIPTGLTARFQRCPRNSRDSPLPGDESVEPRGRSTPGADHAELLASGDPVIHEFRPTRSSQQTAVKSKDLIYLPQRASFRAVSGPL